MKVIKEIHCSALARPMHCLGSLQIDKVDTTSDAAREGTAAGEWLRHLLQPDWGSTQNKTHASNGVTFDDDMKFHAANVAEEILNNIEGSVHSCKGVLCEQQIDWVTRSGIVIAGKYDASFVREGKLYIDDLKYGWGIVEVKENWQLLGYAIGEVIRRGTAFDRIVLRIRQPRPHHEDGDCRAWELTYAELCEYKERIEARMDQIASGNTSCATGTWCKYCPGTAQNCGAFSRALYSSVDHTLNEYREDSLNEKEISEQLQLLERVNDIFKIKFESLKQLAVNRIKEGKIVPNYAMIDQLGNREWKNTVTPGLIEALCGIDATRKEMLSPAQAEKIGVPKELVKSYTSRFSKGQTVKFANANAIGDKIFGTKAPGGS